MGSPRETDDERPRDEPPRHEPPRDEPPRDGGPRDAGTATPAEDRAAILSRRAFLIESALASAGITVGLAGCDRGKPGGPQVCLSPPPQKGPDSPQMCLKVAPRECLKVAPRVCLEVAPRPCLKLAPPRDGGAPQPRPCLSVAPRREPTK
jgi:hypothetical protein